MARRAAAVASLALIAAGCGSLSSPGVAHLSSGAPGGSARAEGGGSPQAQHQAEERALKFSACLRAHGEPNLPDPEFGGSGDSHAVKLGGGKIDLNSPQFKAALKVCLRYFPGGPKGE